MRTEETGEIDLEVMLPADGLPAAWGSLLEAGTALGIKAIGSQAREALRIEAGIPKAGTELNEEIVPPEANLEGKAFSLTKGCYPGQEVVARMDTYGNVRRRLVGLSLKDSVVPPTGARLFSGDREVGWVSSAVYSPQLQDSHRPRLPAPRLRQARHHAHRGNRRATTRSRRHEPALLQEGVAQSPALRYISRSLRIRTHWTRERGC